MSDQCPCGRKAATQDEHAEAHAKRMCVPCFDINQYVTMRYPSHKTVHQIEASQADVRFMPIAQLQS